MNSDPNSGSIILKIAWIIDDLPAPVRPTIPILDFGLTEKLIFFNTKGRCGWYRAEKLTN